MSSAEKGATDEIEFCLGDLVVAKFEEYPYWPALVQRCFWKNEKYQGKWLMKGTGNETPKLWCFFLEDQSANWVPSSKVKRFTPIEARRILCKRGSPNYASQKAAIEEATQIYSQQIESISSHSSSSHNDTDGDICLLGVSADSDEHKKRPRNGGDEDKDDQNNKRIKWSTSLNPDVVDSNSNLKENCGVSPQVAGHDDDTATVASLRKAIQRKQKDLESAISMKNALERRVADCDDYIERFMDFNAYADIPDFPLHIDMQLPEKSTHNSVLMSSNEFEEALEELKRSLFNFKYKLKKCKILREGLSNAIVEKKSGLNSVFAHIENNEQLALKEHNAIAESLRYLLAGSVHLNDLRKYRAGTIVTQILKNSDNISCLKLLCKSLIKKWREQCNKFDSNLSAPNERYENQEDITFPRKIPSK